MNTLNPSANLSQTSLDWSYLPDKPLYGEAVEDVQGPGWVLSPTPFAITSTQFAQLQRLGPVLLKLMQAVDDLYRQSQNPNLPIPRWVSELYDQGKPEPLLQFARMKRTKAHIPMVLRPDLLLHENDGWTLCEIDAVPGGLGFTSALNHFYRKNGFSVVEAPNTLPGAFLEMLKAFVPHCENPVIAIILSDEAEDYQAEMSWLVEALCQGGDSLLPYPNIVLLHPKEVALVRDRLVFTDPVDQTEKSIDLIYRFFELFDLPNIPQMELIQYAIKKGFVQCTPPFKPHLEEKLTLALLHHPLLADFWQKALGKDDFAWLKQSVPPGWIVDPTPIPPQAVIANLAPSGRMLQDFGSLKTLSQKERELVLKPSGFSPLGWGSRGVTIGHDYSAEEWGKRVDEALASFGKTPYILQEFVPAGLVQAERIDRATGTITPFKARTRLCPYYFVHNGDVQLAGVLATSCPADKKLIHGMKDAVLSPVMVRSEE